MPELTAESSSPPVAGPPSIHPDAWEDFAVFRESFLMYFTAPGLNAALRQGAEGFFALLLENSGGEGWPDWQESSTRTELRVALADLRHLVGFLASIGQERRVSSLSPARRQAVQVRRGHGPHPESDRQRNRAEAGEGGGVMSFWKPERTYPLYAKTVTFKAVESQIDRWDVAAKKHNRGSRGAFIAWAVDFACFALEAQERAHEERQREMHLWDRKRDE